MVGILIFIVLTWYAAILGAVLWNDAAGLCPPHLLFRVLPGGLRRPGAATKGPLQWSRCAPSVIPLSDSHIFEPQSGAVFDAAEGFEA